MLADGGRRPDPLARALLDVAQHLQAAAHPLNARVQETPGLAALAAIPAAVRIQPDPTAATHGVPELLHRAIGSAERLHRVAFVAVSATTAAPTVDPTGLAVTASAFASSHAMTARCLRHLADHAQHLAPDLTAPRVGRAMRDSADAAEHAYQRWLAVRDVLRGARGLHTRGLGVPMRVEAENLVVAVGRLVHADPDWQPRIGGHELRPAGELAPHPVALAELCTGLHRVGALAALTAHRHAALVRPMAHSGQLMLPTRWLPASDDVRRVYTPLPEAEMAMLVRRYVSARDATAEAACRLGRVPQLLGNVRADIGAEIELTRWRVPAGWRTEPAALDLDRPREPIALAL